MFLDAINAWGQPQVGWWLDNALLKQSEEDHLDQAHRQAPLALDEGEHPHAHLMSLLRAAGTDEVSSRSNHAHDLVDVQTSADYARAIHLLRRIKHAWKRWEWGEDHFDTLAVGPNSRGDSTAQQEEDATSEHGEGLLPAIPDRGFAGAPEPLCPPEDTADVFSDAAVSGMALHALYGHPAFLSRRVRTPTIRPMALRNALQPLMRCGVQRLRLLHLVQHQRSRFLAAGGDAALAALVNAVATVLCGHAVLLETVAAAVSLRRLDEDAGCEGRWGSGTAVPGTVLEVLHHTRHYRRQVHLVPTRPGCRIA
jgi:hypothetical protein